MARAFWATISTLPPPGGRATLDYLTLEYLAELTLSILARVREKDPQAGYAADFLEVLASLTPELAKQPQLKIVTNAGGMNPRCCAAAAARTLVSAGLPQVMIAVVTGDDLLARVGQLQAAGCTLAHLDTGRPLSELGSPVVSANAYLGARPIVESLVGGARLVITGRVADASLTVGPAVHEFGLPWNDWDRLARASVAGHLIECGAKATGGVLSALERNRSGRRRLPNRRTGAGRHVLDHQAGRNRRPGELRDGQRATAL